MKGDSSSSSRQKSVTPESISRHSPADEPTLRRKFEELETVFDLLKSLPDQEANALLQRLRGGAEVADVVAQTKTGSTKQTNS